MKIAVEITEIELKAMILQKLEYMMPGSGINATDIKIEVKSKQNYKSEWEEASFRARVENHQ